MHIALSMYTILILALEGASNPHVCHSRMSILTIRLPGFLDAINYPRLPGCVAFHMGR